VKDPAGGSGTVPAPETAWRAPQLAQKRSVPFA
jgi:hypothetical protein